MKSISAAITPCPNDVFSFYYLITGALQPKDAVLEFIYRDVEALNEAALSGIYDVTKLSFHAFLKAGSKYRMLKAGAALGNGCGPLLVARAGNGGRPGPGSRVALPGRLTTASLLYALYSGGGHSEVHMRYDRIMDAVKAGEADFGVVIHEGRFVYRERGLECLQDLGEWWQARTGLPVPLGCIAVRAGMGEAAAEEFGELLRESILMARSDVEATIPLVTRHAQELEPDVLRRHISTYVNDYSLDLSKEGLRAMREMEKMARGAGILR